MFPKSWCYSLASSSRHGWPWLSIETNMATWGFPNFKQPPVIIIWDHSPDCALPGSVRWFCFAKVNSHLKLWLFRKKQLAKQMTQTSWKTCCSTLYNCKHQQTYGSPKLPPERQTQISSQLPGLGLIPKKIDTSSQDGSSWCVPHILQFPRYCWHLFGGCDMVLKKTVQRHRLPRLGRIIMSVPSESTCGQPK